MMEENVIEKSNDELSSDISPTVDTKIIRDKLKSEKLKEAGIDEAKGLLNLAKIMQDFLEKIYRLNKKELEFPIDIQLVARTLGFQIKRESLNESEMDQFGKILSQVIITEEERWIQVDNKIGYKTQQYAIAHSIARFLLLDQEKGAYEKSYAIPLMPSEITDVVADKVALFLLLPLDLFKEEFKKYLLSIKDYPLDVDEWLSYLSDRSQVNMFNLAIGYQQLKQAAYSERMDKFYAYLDSLKDEGNLLFHDKDEKIFKLIKFRTMSNAKDKNGNLLPDEQRLNVYVYNILRNTLDVQSLTCARKKLCKKFLCR